MGKYDNLTREQLIERLEEAELLKKEELRYMLEGEKRIAQALMLMLQDSDSDYETSIMRIVLDHYQADRAFIFQFDWQSGTNSNVFEVYAEGVSTEIHNLQRLPNAAISEYIRSFKEGLPIVIDDIGQIGDYGYRGKKSVPKVFESLKLKSAILFPMKIAGKLWGYVGMETVKEYKCWNEHDIQWLQAFTDVLCIGISQKEAHRQIIRNEQCFARLFRNMPVGFVRYQIICDENNQPVDCRYLEVNPAFEKFTGLKKEQCIGKTARQICGKLDDEIFSTCVKVAYHNLQTQLNYFSSIQNRWYYAVLYSPAPGEFISLFYDITRQYEANSQIRQNENKLRSIFNNMPVGIISFGEDGRLLDANEKSLEIFGFQNKDEIEEIDWLTPRIKEQLSRQQCVSLDFSYDPVLHRQLTNEAKISDRVRFITGKLLAYNNEGNTEYMLISADNTPINQALRKIRENEQIWSQVAKVANMFKWKYNCDTKQLSVSDDIRRYSNSVEKDMPTENILRHYIHHIHPHDAKLIMEEWRQCLSNPPGNPYEVTYAAQAEGKEFYCSSRWTKVLEGREEIIYGITIDITDLMLAEKALKENLVRLSLILETGEIYPWYLDLQTGLLDIGENFYEAFGQKKEDYQNYSVDEFISHIHPEDSENFKITYRQLQEGQIAKLRVEIRINIFGTRYWWCEINAAARERDKGSGISKLIGFLTIIQERKDNELKLIETRKKAEESDKLKSAFLANVSHEIRTPLNAIIGFSEIIANTENDEEKNYYLDIIKTNNSLLLNLINDILDLSKIESGRIDFNYSQVNVTELCHELCDIHQLRAHSGVTVQFSNPSSQLLFLYTDRNRLLQIFSNLINNAIKNTVSGSITLDYLICGDHVKFSVEDTGKGMPKDKHHLIFNRFEKLDANAQGFGLGLPICKSILEKMGGIIFFESEPGTGTKFTFTLPYQNQVPEEQTGKTTDTPATPCVHHYTGKKEITILVAEDIDGNYQLLQAILGKKYHLIRAENGLQAITLFTENQPDIILMDMKMPELDGIEATKIIREYSPEIPIIALTAFAYDSDKEIALAAGCNDFVTKPVDSKTLKTLIEKYTLITEN